MASKLMPLRMGTRQRYQPIGSVAFAAGQAAQPIEIPRVGLLNRLVLSFSGTVTKSGAAAIADLSPWAILSRLRLNINTGSASIVDVSGFGAYLMQRVLNEGWSPDAAGLGSSAPHADVFAAPTATASPVAFSLVIPIAANNGAQFDIGTLNLQAPEVRATVEVVWGALTDYAADCTALTGTLSVGYLYYEVPDLRQFGLPPLSIVRMVEEQQPISNTGDNIYNVPRMGTVLQMAHLIRLNGARSDSFDEVGIRFNKSDQPYKIARKVQRVIERYNYPVNPITGAVYWDFFRSYESLNAGDYRDALDTEEITTTESVVTVSAGASLGVGNNMLHTVRRIVQVLEG